MKLFRIHVMTDAKRDSIRQKDDLLTVSVTASPKRNQANQHVLALVKKHLNVKRIELVSGHHKAHKVVRVA